MDPLSITTGVIALLGACITTGVALKEFYDGATTANIKIKGLLTDVESFTQVLQLIKTTLEQENIKSSLQSTGHIGNHWNNLSTSIQDGQTTLRQLQETIEKANKSVSLLDGPRRHLRLKSASDEIAVYQQQIRSYRDTLQLSLQTVILWNQVTVRESTDKILPNLDELQQAVRRIAFDLNARISGLQDVIESNSSDHEFRSLKNLRNCVKSAASVVSSASTTLGVDQSTRLSSYGSEFGDCFPPEPSEAMLRWISSNTVQESEEQKDVESLLSRPKSASGQSMELPGESPESDQSDSDGELEAEIIQSLLRLGKEKLASREFEDAERHFRNCLGRASSNGSSVSLHRLVVPTSEIMTLLLATYREQKKWDEAHSLLIKKIALESRGSSGTNQGVLADRLVLVEVLLRKSAYAEALLHGRRALKSYRRLGSEGRHGVTDSLRLLCQVCNAAGNHDEEDAFSAMLSDFQQKPLPEITSAISTVSAEHDSETATSLAGPIVERSGPVKEAITQGLSSLNTSDIDNNIFSGGQLTPSSTARSHSRGTSLSSLGSAGTASPNTVYTSFSATSREGLPSLKESLPDSGTTFGGDLSSVPGNFGEHIPELSTSPRLAELTGKSIEGSDSAILPVERSTEKVTVASESSEVNQSCGLQEEPATDSASYPLLSPKSLLKRQISKVPASMFIHFQKNIEEDAIKYFRESKGNMPPKIPIVVSDYELPQWIGTLQQDAISTEPIRESAESGKVFLESPQRMVQKSKSAVDLFDSGIAELPTELLHKSKSTISLREKKVIPRNSDRLGPAKPTSVVNEEDNWDIIYRPPAKTLFPDKGRPNIQRYNAIVADKDRVVSDTTDVPTVQPVISASENFDLGKIDSVVEERNQPDTVPSSKSILEGALSWDAAIIPKFQSHGNISASTITQPQVETSLRGADGYCDFILEKVSTPYDAFIETLVGMGYSRTKAIDALEKCEFDLERAADHLIIDSKEESNSASLPTKHNRSTSKEKHMGVLDFRFFVNQVSGMGESVETPTDLQASSSSGPPTRPVSFQELVQLQSKKNLTSSQLVQTGPTELKTRWSEHEMTGQSKPLKKSVSLQDENLRPRNLFATYFGVDHQVLMELPGNGILIANDLSSELAAQPTPKSEEAGPSNRTKIHDSAGTSMANLSNTPAITFSEILNDLSPIRRKLVLIGDPLCGKSSLCSVFSQRFYPKDYHPTDLATIISYIDVDGKTVELVLWDTGGDANNTNLRLKCYTDSHIVLICFAIDSPDSLHNAEELFTKELRKAYNGAPRYMLVGLKGDLRHDWETIDKLKPHFQHPVTQEEARLVAFKIGAIKYVECSALTGEFVKDVFETSARLALMPVEKIRKSRSFRHVFGKE